MRLVWCLGVALLDPVRVVELVIVNAGIRLIRIIRLEAERFHGCRPLTPVLTGDVVVLGLAMALFRLLLRLQLRLLLLLMLLPIHQLLLH